MSEWTEGVCDDGAAILRDGQMVPITELLAHLNAMERAVSAERDACALHIDHLAAGADLAKRNYTAIGESDHAERHEHYRTAYVTAAAAIRARGEAK